MIVERAERTGLLIFLQVFLFFMAQPQEGVYQKSIQSGKWFVINIVIQRFLGLISFFVLARLLIPEDYGIMAAIYLVVNPLSRLTDFSFGDALMQKTDSIEPYLDSVWTFDLFRNIFLCIFLYALAPWLVVFFHIPIAYLPLLRFSGLLLLLPALSNVRQIYFFKELNYQKIFIRDLIGQISFVSVAVVWAFHDSSVWALFLGTVAQFGMSAVMTYILFPSWPHFSFAFSRLRSLVGYTKWVYGQNILDLLLGQLDKWFVGHFLAPAELGIYSKAKDLASTATAVVSSMIKKIGFAAFSKIQQELAKVQDGFLQSIDVLMMTSLPFALLLLLEGGGLVAAFLGPKWLSVVVTLKIFAFGNFFLAFTRAVQPVLAALGFPHVNFKINVAQIIVSIPLWFIGLHWFGLPGLAVATVCGWVLSLGYAMWLARSILRIPKQAFASTFWSTFLGCAAGFLFDFIARLATQSLGDALWIPLVRAAGIGFCYFAVLFLWSRRADRGPWITFCSTLRALKII